MADPERAWLDYANFAASIAVGAIGIFVAVRISQSADHIARSSLLVTMAEFLLDDSPKRQSAGVDMARWAFQKYPAEVPEWAQRLIGDAAGSADATLRGTPLHAPSTPGNTGERPTVGSPAVSSTGASDATVANKLFAAVGGSLPRLFIQVTDNAQRARADQLRGALKQAVLNGDPIVTPGIETVRPTTAPHDTQLRYLKAADVGEARKLAAMLTDLLGVQVAATDLSRQFESHADVKPRTYELWFPRDQ